MHTSTLGACCRPSAFIGNTFKGQTASVSCRYYGCASWARGAGRRRTVPGIIMSTPGDEMAVTGSRLVMKDTPPLGSSKNKMLHVVYRVGDMDRTIKFYQEVFGMEVPAARPHFNRCLGHDTMKARCREELFADFE